MPPADRVADAWTLTVEGMAGGDRLLPTRAAANVEWAGFPLVVHGHGPAGRSPYGRSTRTARMGTDLPR
ncbi:hypothetical protein [Streptomyces kanamyceticus]|uniref:hypothetical protein n=1 Tax=Streptomyces kanamyceticus TaxID=1967 RepID=UPI0037DD3CE9